MLEKLKWKWEVYGNGEEGLGNWDNYRNTAKVCQGATRKASTLGTKPG